jgi:endonuclease YncB( thermonuclease family)
MSKIAQAMALLLFGACVQATEIAIPAADVEVEDGDTIIIKLDGKQTHIQLSGIDAPEDKDNPKLALDIKRTGLEHLALVSLGQAATEHLTKLIQASDQVLIDLEGAEKDRYGRLNLLVKDSQGNSLNETMVKDGYAIGLKTANQTFKDLQEAARTNKLGLWAKPETATWADSQ